jgi:hypothetical protein
MAGIRLGRVTRFDSTHHDRAVLPELSDADRERLRRERERVERKIAKDRDRIHAALAAERRRLDEAEARRSPEVAAAHLRAYGPATITGPDGVTVLLAVTASGRAKFRRPPEQPGDSGTVEAAGCLMEFGLFGFALVDVIGLAIGIGYLLRRYLTRSGFVLRIQAPGLERRHRKHRTGDEDTAAGLLAAAAAAITHGGVAALRRWAVE